MTNGAIRPVFRPVKIIFSYAHEDDPLREQLARHLSPLRKWGRITTWFDRDILAGTEKSPEVSTKFNEADIILLLLSADFMASDYLYSIEMQTAIKKHKAGIARVIPIILRPVDWKETPIGTLQVLPRNEKPITLWKNRDEAFLSVVQSLREVITEVARTNHEALLHIPLNKSHSVTVAVDLGTAFSGFAYAFAYEPTIYVCQDLPAILLTHPYLKTTRVVLYSPERQFELISDYLKKLKEFVIEKIKEQSEFLENDEFRWCFMTPVSWTFEQRRQVRLASQKAGLISLNNEDQLIFVSRPEAAITGFLEEEGSKLSMGMRFMVIDATDELVISIHEIDKSLNINDAILPTHFSPELEITEEQLEAQRGLSQPILDRMMEEIEKLIVYLGKQPCNFLCLVGETASVPHFQETIKQRFSRKVGQIITPKNPTTVLLKGAVSLGKPSLIRARRAHLTYGLEIALPFDPSIDPASKKFLDHRLGTWLCSDRFDVLVRAGEIIEPGTVISRMFLPLYTDQREMAISLYTTRDRQVRYIDEKRVSKIGQLTLLRRDTNRDLDWMVEVKIGFNGSDITIEARDV